MNPQIKVPTELKLEDLPPRTMLPGFNGRFIHTSHTSHVFWEIDQGHELPEHSHPNEQVVTMLAGTFELRVDGVPHRLEPGKVLVIPPNVPHSGVAITDSRILDVFTPPREDYY